MTVQIQVREETAAKLQTIASTLQLSLDDYLTRLATFATTQPASNDSVNDPAFTMTFRGYLAMNAAERKTMTLELQTRHQDWLARQFESLRAAWLLVIGGKVMESSPRLDDHPSPERLMKMGEEHNLIPFVFSRPPLFEETSWSALPADDFYPTLALTIGAREWEHDQLLAQGLARSADFDTGSPYLFLSWDWLLSAGLVTDSAVDFPQAWQHLGRRYVYYTRFLRVGVADAAGATRSREMACECVEDWQRSPLCEVNSARQALAGRNLLLGFPLTVELNGAERKTTVTRC